MSILKFLVFDFGFNPPMGSMNLPLQMKAFFINPIPIVGPGYISGNEAMYDLRVSLFSIDEKNLKLFSSIN